MRSSTLAALLMMCLAACTMTEITKASALTNSVVAEEVIEEGADDISDDDNDDDELDDGEDVEENEEPNVSRTNPCSKKKCQRGEDCIVENEKAKCICTLSCQADPNPRHKVCASRNKTFDSECHLEREFCYCRNKMPECSTKNYKKLRLAYYGECKDLPKCTKEAATQFPQRMEAWLVVVMKALAAKQELAGYEDFLEPSDDVHRRINAVIWKFCDLDVHPHDRRVSRRELQFIIASVRPMEPCLVPFLNKCDVNDDRKISLKEWGTCLGLERNVIQDKCKNLRKQRRKN